MSRTSNVNFRVTAQEKAQLQTEATANGLSVGDYVRMKALGVDATPTAYATLNSRVEDQSTQIQSLESEVRTLAARIQDRHFGGRKAGE